MADESSAIVTKSEVSAKLPESTTTAVSAATFELTDAEATTVRNVQTRKQRRLFFGVFGANIVLNLILAGLELFGFGRQRYADFTQFWFHIGIASLFGFSLFATFQKAKPRKQRAWSISFDDAGMTIAADPAPSSVVPWHEVESAFDSGICIELRYGKRRWVTIPRRIYTDGGAALWLLLQEKLIGTRLLQRRSDSRIIVNTAQR